MKVQPGPRKNTPITVSTALNALAALEARAVEHGIDPAVQAALALGLRGGEIQHALDLAPLRALRDLDHGQRGRSI